MLRIEMTNWQRQVVEAVIKEGTYEKAARILGVKVGSVTRVFHALRENDGKCVDYHKELLQYQKKLGPKSRYSVI